MLPNVCMWYIVLVYEVVGFRAAYLIWTSTGYFSKSTGSFATNRRFSPYLYRAAGPCQIPNIEWNTTVQLNNALMCSAKTSYDSMIQYCIMVVCLFFESRRQNGTLHIYMNRSCRKRVGVRSLFSLQRGEMLKRAILASPDRFRSVYKRAVPKHSVGLAPEMTARPIPPLLFLLGQVGPRWPLSSQNGACPKSTPPQKGNPPNHLSGTAILCILMGNV